jgi:hypothetical protein
MIYREILIHHCSILGNKDMIKIYNSIYSFLMAQQRIPTSNTSLLKFRNHIHTHTHTHSLGLLWMSDRSVGETSLPDSTQHPQHIQTSMSPAGFENAISTKLVAADLHRIRHSHWDQQHYLLL